MSYWWGLLLPFLLFLSLFPKILLSLIPFTHVLSFFKSFFSLPFSLPTPENKFVYCLPPYRLIRRTHLLTPPFLVFFSILSCEVFLFLLFPCAPSFRLGSSTESSTIIANFFPPNSLPLSYELFPLILRRFKR